MSNRTPVTVTTISQNDLGEFVESTRQISYAEAIKMHEDYLDMVLQFGSFGYDVDNDEMVFDEDDDFGDEAIEALLQIIEYRIKKIKQDHCE